MNDVLHIIMERPGREGDKFTVDGLDGVRAAMFAYQRYTEADDFTAVNTDTGERYARLRFEWLED